MQDGMGRGIGYLRLSVTRECPMRCIYCRPAHLRMFSNKHDLTADEIVMLVQHLAHRHGVKKVRLTGGEPTARRDLVTIIKRLAAIDQIDELAMTTNGLTLSRDAARFVDAGLGRVNVSLDSLDPVRFKRLTGVDGLSRLLAGIAAAQERG